MAASTGTVYKAFPAMQESIGQFKVITYAIDLSGVGADGFTMTAGTAPFDDFKKFAMVEVLGAVETLGYVAQFVPSSIPAADEFYIGNGALFVVEAGADGAALDEVETGDIGVFLVRIRGW